MPKTKQELYELKQEIESLKNKLKDLSEDELKEIAGGTVDAEEILGGKIWVVPTDNN